MTRWTTSGPDFLSCNRHGVAETRTELDAAAIREAAQRAVILWPEEPGFGPADAYGWKSQTVIGGHGGCQGRI